LQNQGGGGTQVRFGDLQLVPIGGGLLFVRPFYVAVSQAAQQVSSVTEFRYVIVNYNGRAAYGESLEDPLSQLLPGFDGDIGDRVAAPSDPDAAPTDPGSTDPDTTDPPSTDETTPPGDSTPPGDTTPDPGANATPEELLEQADQLLIEADDVLRESGDLGEYQRLVQEAGVLIDRALTALAET